MKVTVGRIVHYTNLGDAEGRYPPETQAAIVTGIYHDPAMEVAPAMAMVDLHIFYRTGQFDMKQVPWSDRPMRGHWNWPPREQAT
jgi:hypothetical protein